MDSLNGSSFSFGRNDSKRVYDSQYRPLRRLYRRHSSQQINILEKAFKLCPHPDERVRFQLSLELGLEPRQVKFWFQNRRTQLKNQTERTDNSSLRNENEKMQAENFIIKEALKNVLCLTCGSPTLANQEDNGVRMQELKLENAYLKQEYQKMQQLLASYNVISSTPMFNQQNVSLSSPTQSSVSTRSLLNTQTEIPSLCQRFHNLLQNITTSSSALDESVVPSTTLSHHTHALLGCTSSSTITLDQVASVDDDQQINSSLLDNQDVAVAMDYQQDHHHHQKDPIIVHDFASLIGNADKDEESEKMLKAAADAMDQLTRLLRMNEPFWFRSTLDGKFILQRESYERMFHKGKRLKGQRSRRESSKDSRLVIMNGPQLVDMFLDSEKWVSMFPTIVRRAYTLEVVENGLPESRSGALQLMYGEMHILSPLVPCREFYFLRYCVQVEVGVWVIADVSFNSSKFNTNTSAWRLPSGCLIHDMNDGSCMVTWVEHVEVNDKFQNQQIFKDLVCEGNAFGAERWVLTLERMCERIAFASMEEIPACDAGGVLTLPEGRRSLMQFSERMVKLFCRSLSDEMEIPYVRVDNCGVRVSVRSNLEEEGEPKGIIVCAATSFWLPLLPHSVFQFLNDPSTRYQWDVLCHGNPVNQIQHISNGSHPDNCTSIIQPNIPNDNNMLLLQECCIDSLGCMMVYAPVDVTTTSAAMAGEDTSTLPILPTGITIAGDGGRPDRAAASTSASASHHHSGGSIVTLVIQVLVCSDSSLDQLNMDSVAAINALTTSTVEKIKVALDCSES